MVCYTYRHSVGVYSNSPWFVIHIGIVLGSTVITPWFVIHIGIVLGSTVIHRGLLYI